VSIAINGLGGELRDLGQAVGILDGSGGFDPDWLGNPLDAIESVLKQPDQRAAFLRFLDDVAPPASISGLPAGEKWHPLLGNQPNGNLYLTVRDLAGSVVLGLAGDFGSSAEPSIQARLRAQMALIQAGPTVGLAGGTTTGPLIGELRLDLNWRRGTGAGEHPIGVRAIVIRATITPDPVHPAFHLQVVLEQLQLTADPAVDKVLDTADLGRDAPSLLAGLLKVVLAQAGADPAAVALANHLLGLFGLDDSGAVPAFPFAQLAEGPQALQQWLGSLIGGSPPSAVQWLQHFAGLFGSTVAVEGAAAGPWSVRLLPLGGVGGLSITVENTGQQARFGVRVALGASLGAGQPTLDLAASAAIADIPLGGTGSARVLPAASVLVSFAGSGGAPLIADATVGVGALRGGVVWDGSRLRPSLELLDVHFGTTTYPRLDLTNLQSVADAAAGAVAGFVDSALGAGVGRRLAAIAGIIPPTTAGAWPHHLDLARLVTDPAGAFGAYHRGVLLDTVNGWGFIFADLAGLLGAAPISGTGTAADPWRVPLAAPIGPLSLQLAAWNAQTTPGAGQPQLLLLGLRIGADSGNVHFSWISELLAFDLPASGAANLAFIGAQTLRFQLQPAINFPIGDDVNVELDTLELVASWSAPAGISWRGTATNLAIHAGPETFTINTLTFPPAAGFDILHIDATAAALGLNAGQLEAAVSFLLTWVAAQITPQSYVAVALAGLHHQLAELPNDAPLLPDPAHPGSLFSDPLAAFRGWVERALAFVDGAGVPYALRLLTWASALIEDRLPDNLETGAPGFDTLEGSGVFDDPWRLGAFRLWLDPAGPPLAWVTGAAKLATAATDFAALAQAVHLLGHLHPPLAAVLGDLSPDDIAARLQALALHLSTSDGVVPFDSQSPEIFAWVHGNPVANTHEKLPSDPSAIQQVLAQIDSFVDGTHPRLVLLLGPSFLDRHAWDALLASPVLTGVTNASANFNLRTPGVDPATVTLSTVSAIADYYTAELADDNSGDITRLRGQIENIANRLAVLQPGKAITLVAHSTAGLAARAYASAHPERVRALITLGTPHMGAPLPFLTDLATGDGARIAQALRDVMPPSALRDALDHILHAMDGYLPAAAASSPPIALSYPAASFNSGAPFDTGTVPVIALQGQLTDDPFAWMQAAAAALAMQVVGSGRAAPTHAGVGVALPMDLPVAAAGAIRTAAELRATLFQIPLHDGVAAPPARPHLRAEIRVSRQQAWLLTGPALGDNRVRDLALRLDVSAAAARVSLELHEAAWHGPTEPVVGTADPIALSAVGDVMRALTDAEAPLVSALAALTIAATNASGDLGISADAWSTLRTDPLSLIGAHLPDALSAPGGFLGITGPPTGPWQWQPSGSPLSLLVTRDSPSGPYRIGISAAAGALFDLDLTTALPALALQVDTSLHAGIIRIRWQSATGTVSIAAPPWLDGLTVVPPPGPAALAAAFNEVWPRFLFSGVLDLVLSIFAPDVRMDRIELLLRDTGAFLQGNIDGPKINGLLQRINQAAGLPAGPGLQLPGSISITGSGGTSAADPIRIAGATTSPLGGVLGLDLGIGIDGLRHVRPAGSISLGTNLASPTWPHITITFSVSDAGLSLLITPEGQPPIQILPTFGGLGALVAAGSELLIAVLDAIVNSFHGAPPAWLARLLTAAANLGVYDAGGGFAAHAASLHAMLDDGRFVNFDNTRRAGVASAVADVIRLIPGLPGTVGTAGGLVTWTFPVVLPDQQVAFAVGWGDSGPALRISARNIRPAGVPVGGTATIDVGSAGIDGDVRLQVFLDSIGIDATPTFDVAVLTTPSVGFRTRLLPLARGADDGALGIQLAPEFAFAPAADMAERLIEGWALPLLVRVALQAAQAEFARLLWSGGPTVQQALQAAGILDGAGHVAAPLPNLFQMVTGFLGASSTTLNLPIGDLHLRLASQAGRIGIGVSGKQDFSVGDLQLTLLFGAPTGWGPPAAEGATVWLIDTGGATTRFNVGLWLHGVGIGIEGAGGDPLVSDDTVRIGALKLYSFFELETAAGLAVSRIGGGSEVGDFGLPLGAVSGSASGSGSNPVASNLLRSGGGGGDNRPANPGVDLDFWYWDYPGMPTPPFQIRLNGQQGVLWIGVHAGFGPIYIDQVGVELSSTNAALLIDGGVSIAGLSAQVDELTIGIPFDHIKDPTGWTLDLKGLALGYSGPGIEIAGGLVKFVGPPIEYDGMLLIKIGTIGVIAVGAYAVVPGSDGYTSIAILGGVFIPIGIPPIINLTGLALGMGYNRKLIVPDDLNAIPSFPLVEALDRPEQLANNPIQALVAFRNASPASRGSFWFAAGLRGTALQVVNVTAVLYVALDTGVEVGLLGVARMTLPSDDTALVSVELALKARFSTAEGLFSVQAQLTDHSWLLSHDCQLTGGFAYFDWFKESQFLLTMGGYHPSFQPRPEYPVVPRLGYHWDVLGVIHIKGESYLARTLTCLMAGARMETSYGPDWLQLWFTAYADFLVSWDPFHYEGDAGVEVGARFRIEVCFIGCVHIDVSVSLGADLKIDGPPLHGVLSVDLAISSVTVEFGTPSHPRPPQLNWNQFALQYLQATDPATVPVGVQVMTGLLPPQPPGGPVAPGTADQPWRLSAEWSFRTETKMAARGFFFQTRDPRSENQMGSEPLGLYDDLSTVYAFDIAPMYIHASQIDQAVHGVTLFARGGAALTLDKTLFQIEPIIGQVAEATWHFFPDFKPPAAANTLPVLAGIIVYGIARLNGASDIIPIAKLRDATNPRPLPFASRTIDIIAVLRAAGIIADTFSALSAAKGSQALLNAYATVLSGATGVFAGLRAQTGLSTPGLRPVAVAALQTRRSAPPVLAPLSYGLSMDAPAQKPPTRAATVDPKPPVALTAPRLRGLLQQQIAPTVAAAAPMRTSVASVTAAASLPRVSVDRDLQRASVIPGARLLLRTADAAPRPTRVAGGLRTVRHADLGAVIPRAVAGSIASIESAVLKDGAAIRAGVTQVWELPATQVTAIQIVSDMPVRIAFLTAAGTLVADGEYASTAKLDLPIPAGCGMVAITGLGAVAGAIRAAVADGRAGGVTTVLAPAGAKAIAGWQVGMHVAQTGANVMLARGATLVLSQVTGVSIAKQSMSLGMIALSEATIDQVAVQTHLPSAVNVVGVLLDAKAGGAIGPDTVAVAADGATLNAVPVRVQGGDRTLLLYDVAPPAAGGAQTDVVITVTSAGDFHLAGVLGMHGSAQTWGAELNGGILAHLVPDAPLSPSGLATIHFAMKATP
jgi:hypothetical protein